jgi:orotidine-5'-phosphate decarboxylase
VDRTIAEKWNGAGNCGLVVGATAPEELARIRAAVPNLWFLTPGIGVQGGSIHNTILQGATDEGSGIAVGSARSIIFAQKPGIELRRLTSDVNVALKILKRQRRNRAGCGTG